ncbi:unnamed protein product [marine sediment metagenome]|uniref:Uncharacterized protein n=1 Tax=marine sediment metagenome TaxID=412755 RepID=X1A060_9ZZZZ
MKYTINDTYPDETHYTIAVMSEEEAYLLREFLSKNKAERMEDVR